MSLREFRTALFLPEYVHVGSDPSIEITERNPAGAGTVRFPSGEPVVVIRNPSDQPPLCWSKNRKCADGAILIEVDEEIHAHIVELKSRIGPGTWLAIKGQFHGMWQNVISVSAVAGSAKPTKVVCHLAFKTEQFSAKRAVDPVLLKVPTGSDQTLSKDDEWDDGAFVLEDFGKVELRKIQRSSADGSASGSL